MDLAAIVFNYLIENISFSSTSPDEDGSMAAGFRASSGLLGKAVIQPL